MLTENYVVKDAPNTEHITDWMRFCRHVLDVDDLWCDIPWSSASYEQVIWIVSHSCQSEVNNDRFLTQNDIVRFEITMNYILSRHFYQTTEDSFHYEFSLVFSVLKKIVETAADWTAFNVLQCKVYRIL